VARPWPGGAKRRGGRASHHEECVAIGSLLLPYAVTGLSQVAVWCLSGATPRGQPWTPAVTLSHGRNGLSARRMAVLSTFREPSLYRHVHGALLRSTLLDLTSKIPAAACHQRNDVERYSRYNRAPSLLLHRMSWHNAWMPRRSRGAFRGRIDAPMAVSRRQWRHVMVRFVHRRMGR
jgi:hypothetical protein